MYEPCYTSTQGLVAFRCRVGACTRVVRTLRGIKMHCLRVHGLREQIEMFSVPVRAENQDGVMTPIAKEKIDGEARSREKPKPVHAVDSGGDDDTLDLFTAARKD